MASPPHPPPGRLVSLGTHRLHLHCVGSGNPTVILDAALGASSLSWSLVQPAVSAFTSVCAYDRAGFGWSDAGPLPRTAGRIAGELHELLVRAQVPPPYVLVGHSFGGLTIRLFAARHPERVAGLVFVDPAHPEDWRDPSPYERERIGRGARLCRHGAIAARFGIARLVAALASAGAVETARRLAAGVSGRMLRRQDEDLLAPVTRLPPDVRRMARWVWTQPRFFEALGSQIEEVCASAAGVDDAPDYGSLPLVTISATECSESRRQRQDALARRSTRGRHIVAASSGHWIPLDEPQVVVSAIREVVEAARAAASAR